MPHQAAAEDVTQSWSSIPRLVAESIDGLDGGDLDQRLEPSGMSARVLVHHIAEANAVATTIVVAALGSPGCTYDWSWMQPFGPWVERMGYGNKPVDTALRALHAINAYVMSLIGSDIDKLATEVFLRDAPAADLRCVTVADVLMQEVTHAKEHVAEICEMREKQSA